jgi:predicted kinase
VAGPTDPPSAPPPTAPAPSVAPGGPEPAILAGLPGSGKGLLAHRLKLERGFFVVSADALRLALNAGVYPQAGPQGDYDLLGPLVWGLAERAVRALLHAGRDVAGDATNLTRQRRRSWREAALSAAPGVRVSVWWCAGRWDTPGRWAQERGYSPEASQEARARREAQAEPPADDEADEARHYASVATDRRG